MSTPLASMPSGNPNSDPLQRATERRNVLQNQIRSGEMIRKAKMGRDEVKPIVIGSNG